MNLFPFLYSPPFRLIVADYNFFDNKTLFYTTFSRLFLRQIDTKFILQNNYFFAGLLL